MRSDSRKCGVQKTFEVGLLTTSARSFSYIGRKQIKILATVFMVTTEVIEATYIRALARGERLPPLLVGCGDRKR